MISRARREMLEDELTQSQIPDSESIDSREAFWDAFCKEAPWEPECKVYEV